MNRRLFSILFVAFLIALACTFVVWRMMSKNLNAPKPVMTRRVVAASGDIKVGSVLEPSNIKSIDVAGTLPRGAILKPEAAIGRAVVSQLYDGEPILESRLAAAGTGGGLAPLIPPGMRACAVKVDEVVGVAGFVTPGMRVDVIASGTPPSAAGQAVAPGPVTQTILQNIRVLSAGSDYQKDSDGKAKQVQVVNLLVTPEQAQSLSLASTQQIKIQLVLRNPLDTKVENIRGTAMSTLFAGEAVPVATRSPQPRVRKVPAVPTYTVEVMNGSKRTEQKFAVPGGRP